MDFEKLSSHLHELTLLEMSTVPPVKELDPYRELPASIRSTNLLFSTSNPSNPAATLSSLPTLLLASSTPHSSLPPSQTYSLKIASKALTLSNPQKLSAASTKKALALATAKKQAVRGSKAAGSVGLLSRKEAKRRSVWVPRTDELSWEKLEGLRSLWEGYMIELLGLGNAGALGANGKGTEGGRWEGNAEGMQTKVAKADFCGCFIKVTDAKNRDLVDVAGIVVHETEQTFKIVTRLSKIKVIPKQSTTFTFSIPVPTPSPTPTQPKPSTPNASASSSRSSTPLPIVAPPPPPPSTSTKKAKTTRLEFDLYGSQFLFRNSDRAGRKFKSHAGIEIEGALG